MCCLVGISSGAYTSYPRSLLQAKDRFPRIVIIIILAEFCERFSYSGMRAFLALYLRSKLGYTDDEATEIYHVFTTFLYVFPIIGGIIADNYIGKYRTILYMLFVYAAGNILVAVTSIPHLPLPGRICTIIGLFMITVGSGGIKPCVTSFGADQFLLPQQERYLAIYFSILYFIFCTASVIAKSVAPILRSEMSCFGEKDCYPMAFGAPGLVVITSIIIFISAKSRYIIKEPEGNVIIDFVKCVSLGLKNALFKRDGDKGSHWLDSTLPRYDKRFVRDVKKTLSVLTLFTVLPMIWALFDQVGSRWTLQAAKMDGRIGPITVKPDQIQVISPLLILFLIPLAQKCIYPFLENRNILTSPLHKIAAGGFFAAVSFLASGAVEMYISSTFPQLPEAGFSQLRVFNGHPCNITIQNFTYNINDTIPSLSFYTKKDILVRGSKQINFELTGSCIEARNEDLLLEENMAISFYLTQDKVLRYKDNVDKSKSGLPFVRFLAPDSIKSNIELYNKKRNQTETRPDLGILKQVEVFTSTYALKVGGEIIAEDIELESGGVYTVMIAKDGDNYTSSVLAVTQPNLITIALLLPQFIIMAIGEVLFAVTGTEFAFKESPESMKAVMSAVWLLTEAFGNVIVIILTHLFVDVRQEHQFFIYSGMALTAISVLIYMAHGYQYGHAYDEVPKKETRKGNDIGYSQVKQTEDLEN